MADNLPATSYLQDGVALPDDPSSATKPSTPLDQVDINICVALLPKSPRVDGVSWPNIPIDGIPGEVGARLDERVTKARTQWLKEVTVNEVLIVSEYLRYAFAKDVDLLILDGIIAQESVEELTKFSARFAIIASVAASPDTRWENFEDRRTKESSVARILVSPFLSVVFDIDATQKFPDFDPRLRRRSKTSDVIFVAQVTSESVSLSTRANQSFVVSTHTQYLEPCIRILHWNGSEVPTLERTFVLFSSTDLHAAELKETLTGLSQPTRSIVDIEQLRQSFDQLQLSTREELAIASILEGDFGADPEIDESWDILILPSTIVTPTTTNYRALDALLPLLQSSIATVDAFQDKAAVSLLEEVWLDVSAQMQTIVDVPEEQKRLQDRRVQTQESRRSFPIFMATLTTTAGESLAIAFERQARLLHVLNKYTGAALSLSYSFASFRSRGGHLRPTIQVQCSASEVTEIEAANLRASFGELVHSTFVGIYGLSFTLGDDPHDVLDLTAGARYRARIILPQAQESDLAEIGSFPDWAHFVDFICSLPREVFMKIEVRRGGTLTGPLGEPQADEPEVIENAMNLLGAHPEYVRMAIFLGSNDPIPTALLNFVSNEVAGSALDKPGSLESDIDAVPFQDIAIRTALRVFHPPFGRWFSGTNLSRSLRKASPVDKFPIGGIALGRAEVAHAKGNVSIPVRLPEMDRLRHVYVIGKTGAGKTNLLRGMVAQDILNPSTGIAVVDPHGDLAEHLINLIPRARMDDLQLIDLSDPDVTPVINPLLFQNADKLSRSRIAQSVLGMLKHRVYHEFSGPRFDEIMRLLLDTLLDPGYPVTPSLVDASCLLTDERRQKAVRQKLVDKELRARWRFHDKLKSGSDYYNLLDWAISKLDDLRHDESLRTVLGGSSNTVDIERVVAENGILVVSIPESVVGRDAAEFIGSLVLLQLKAAIMRRRRHRVPAFHLYVDEFQKFAGVGFEELLAEGRKFGLGLVMAHQNTEQLRSFSSHTGQSSHALLNSILGNVGTMIVFPVGAQDASLLAPQLGVTAEEVDRIGRYQALARMTVDAQQLNAFVMTTDFALQGLDPRNADDIREHLTRHSLLVTRDSVSQEIDARYSRLLAADESTSKVAVEDLPLPETDSKGGSKFLDEWLTKRRAVRKAHAEKVSDSSRPKMLSPVRENQKAASTWSEVIGPVVRLEDVARWLDRPIQELRHDADRGLVMVLRTKDGTEVVPRSHLDANGFVRGLWRVLPVLARAPFGPWTRAAWFATPNAALGGISPVQALREGFEESVIVALVSAYSEDY